MYLTSILVASSSDIRIKEDIEDINDDSVLNMILAIEPKCESAVLNHFDI